MITTDDAGGTPPPASAAPRPRSRWSSRRAGLAATAGVGVVGLVLAVVLASAGGDASLPSGGGTAGPGGAGERPSVTAAAMPPVVTVAPPPAPAPGAAALLAPAPVPARTSDRRAPATLTLPGGASAAVDALAPHRDGVLDPPRDPARLGWWVHSALPGSGAGVVVVTGHINWNGRAGFARRWLPPAAGGTTHPGDIVTLTTTAAGPRRYRITDTRAYPKDQGLPAEVGRSAGPETLLLVTCGGAWVGGHRGYVDNLVTTAVPV